jgi:hypothetical protein
MNDKMHVQRLSPRIAVGLWNSLCYEATFLWEICGKMASVCVARLYQLAKVLVIEFHFLDCTCDWAQPLRVLAKLRLAIELRLATSNQPLTDDQVHVVGRWEPNFRQSCTHTSCMHHGPAHSIVGKIVEIRCLHMRAATVRSELWSHVVHSNHEHRLGPGWCGWRWWSRRRRWVGHVPNEELLVTPLSARNGRRTIAKERARGHVAHRAPQHPHAAQRRRLAP